MSLRKIGKESSFLVSYRYFAALINILIVFILTKYLGPSKYGVYSLVTSFIPFIAGLTSLGLNSTIPYFISKELSKKNFKKAKAYALVSLKIESLVGLSMCILLFLLSNFLESIYNIPNLGLYIKIISASVFFSLIFNFLVVIFASFKKLKYSWSSDLCSSISRLIFIIVLMPLGLFGVVSATSIGLFIPFAITLFLFFSKVLPKTGLSDINLKQLFKKSLTTYFGDLFAMFLVSIANFILGFFPSEMSYWNIGLKLLGFIVMPISSISLALTSGLSEKSEANAKKDFVRASYYIFYISALFSFGLVSVVDPLINIIDQRYLEGSLTIKLIVGASFIFSSYIIFDSLALSTNHQKNYFVSRIVQGVLSLALMPLFSFYFKAIGSAVAMILIYSGSLLYYIISLKSFAYKEFFKILFVSFIALYISTFFFSFFKGLVFVLIFFLLLGIKPIKKLKLIKKT